MAEPRLRFTKEDGMAYPPLENANMGDYYVERNERGCEGLPVLTVSIHSGVSDGELDEDELGKRVKRSADMTSYKKAEAGDLVFNMMRAWQGAVGSVKTTGMVSPAYIVAKPKSDIVPSYMDFYVQTKTIIDRFNRLSYGALDFRKRLYWDSFITTEVNIPTIEEQQKIADFLSSVDEVITTSEKEIENLEKQKKSVMKKIFSKEIQFKKDDGTEYKNSTRTKLKDCVYYRSSSISVKDAISEGQYALYDAIRMIGHYNSCVNEKYISIIKDGAGVGRVRILPAETICIGTMGIITAKECCLLEYIYAFLQQLNFNCYVIGGAIPHIYFKDYGEENLILPCLEEQKKIADFLSDFDEAIAAAKKELELWKELKKGLLQQMFV